MIYWDKNNKRWVHLLSQKTLFWGKERKALQAVPTINSDLSFPVKKKKQKIGPLVGILASYHEAKQFTGNIKLFRKLQKELAHKGGILFIFTLKDVKAKHLTGFVYNERTLKWIKAIFPYPDIIYNRISKRQEEKSKSFSNLSNSLNAKSIPFFNPHFFNKWSVLSTLQSEIDLSTYIPFTMKFSSYNDLLFLKHSFSKIYVKPIAGSKGNGIFTLAFHKNHIMIQTQSTRKKFTSLPLCWNEIEGLMEGRKYLAQEAVNVRTFEGNHFDLRVHTHRVKESWDITGIGIRLAKLNGITTHVPQGGSIAKKEEINVNINEDKIKQLMKRIGTTLEKKFGLIGEFSVDIGIDIANNYYIFEVNSKPMLFDEENIEQKRIKHLVDSFYELTNFE